MVKSSSWAHWSKIFKKTISETLKKHLRALSPRIQKIKSWFWTRYCHWELHLIQFYSDVYFKIFREFLTRSLLPPGSSSPDIPACQRFIVHFAIQVLRQHSATGLSGNLSPGGKKGILFSRNSHPSSVWYVWHSHPGSLRDTVQDCGAWGGDSNWFCGLEIRYLHLEGYYLERDSFLHILQE